MPGLEFIDIHKSFGAVRALRGVSLSVRSGETHALIGENGAGKSTLLKILAGIVAPDAGEIRWEDVKLPLSGPRDALAHGIGMVYQELLTFPNLTVSGNIFAGRELTGRGGVLLEREMRVRTRDLLGRLHLALPPDARMEHLSAAHCQLVQVARALAFECRVLVLDEPTTALTSAEADHLFRVLDDLRQRGVTILYVSHRLPGSVQAVRPDDGPSRRAVRRHVRPRSPSGGPPSCPARPGNGSRLPPTSCARWSAATCRRERRTRRPRERLRCCA